MKQEELIELSKAFWEGFRDAVTLKPIRQMWKRIQSLALYLGHYPMVLNPTPSSCNVEPVPVGEVLVSPHGNFKFEKAHGVNLEYGTYPVYLSQPKPCDCKNAVHECTDAPNCKVTLRIKQHAQSADEVKRLEEATCYVDLAKKALDDGEDIDLVLHQLWRYAADVKRLEEIALIVRDAENLWGDDWIKKYGERTAEEVVRSKFPATLSHKEKAE